MSDVSVGIETKLDSTGTKGLEKDLTAAKAMTDALTKATEKQNEVATQTKETVQQKSETEKESAESMRNLQGVSQQLTAALNGNVTAMAKSIQVSPQFATALQGAFSVIGAATFGYGIGSAIFKSIVEPSMEAKAALMDLSGVTAQYAATLDKEAFEKYAESTKQIAENYQAQSDALDENAARMERAFNWAKKLLDVSYEIEELRIKSMPDGIDKEKALVGLKERKGKDTVALEMEQAQAGLSEAGQRAILADTAFNRAKSERDQKLERAKKELEGIDRVAGAQAKPAIEEANSQGSWWNAIISMFRGGPDFSKSNGLIANFQRGNQLQDQIGALENDEQLKKLEEEKIKAEKAFWDARESARYTQRFAADKNTAIDQGAANDIGKINSDDEARRSKAAAELLKASLEADKKNLEEDRRTTKERLDLAGKRGLPEQVTAQRESAEAQSAQAAYSRNPSAANRRNLEGARSAASMAAARADEAVEALAKHLQNVTAKLQVIDQKIKNLSEGGLPVNAALAKDREPKNENITVGPARTEAPAAMARGAGDQQSRERGAREGAGASDIRSLEQEQRLLEEDRRDTERKLDLASRRGLPEQRAAQRETSEASLAGSRFSRDPSEASRRNYERELSEAKAAVEQSDRTVALLSKHLQTVNDQYKKLEQQIKNMPTQ